MNVPGKNEQYLPLEDRLETVRGRVERAARSAGRDSHEVHLLAVSKQKPVEAIVEAARLGLRAFGESYVDEAVQKIVQVAVPDVEWYFLGTIQSNKTRAIAENFGWALGVATERVARRLHEQRPHDKPPLSVTIQVNVDADPAKSGVAPAELPRLIETCEGLAQLQVQGLMTIPRRDSAALPDSLPFLTLADFYHRYARPRWDTLSMGMSRDLEAAVASGSTQVRIGTDLFGVRSPRSPREDGA